MSNSSSDGGTSFFLFIIATVLTLNYMDVSFKDIKDFFKEDEPVISRFSDNYLKGMKDLLHIMDSLSVVVAEAPDGTEGKTVKGILDIIGGQNYRIPKQLMVSYPKGLNPSRHNHFFHLKTKSGNMFLVKISDEKINTQELGLTAADYENGVVKRLNVFVDLGPYREAKFIKEDSLAYSEWKSDTARLELEMIQKNPKRGSLDHVFKNTEVERIQIVEGNTIKRIVPSTDTLFVQRNMRNNSPGQVRFRTPRTPKDSSAPKDNFSGF
jgi:hypothetical protein